MILILSMAACALAPASAQFGGLIPNIGGGMPTYFANLFNGFGIRQMPGAFPPGPGAPPPPPPGPLNPFEGQLMDPNRRSESSLTGAANVLGNGIENVTAGLGTAIYHLVTAFGSGVANIFSGVLGSRTTNDKSLALKLE